MTTTMSQLNAKHIRENTEPIDTFTLTDKHFKEGQILSGSSCPVACMIRDEYHRTPYDDINVCRINIEYECEGHEMIKENSWALLALIHAIDHPEIITRVIDKINGKTTHLFGGNKAFQPPYTIEEYEHYFNLLLPGFDKAHLDTFTIRSDFDEDMNLKTFDLLVTPYTGELK